MLCYLNPFNIYLKQTLKQALLYYNILYYNMSTTRKRKIEKVTPDEYKLLQKQMDRVYNILREPNYIIVVAKSKLIQNNIQGWYTFNMIDPDMSTPDYTLIVSSVSISVKRAPILTPPITRSTRPQMLDTFHIELVDTHDAYRGKGNATLLLIYGMSYLKQLFPNINFFTLNDESNLNKNIEGNIYHRLGFVFMYKQSMDLSKSNKTIQIDTTKILDFNREPIDHWVDVRCISLINEIRAKGNMDPINTMALGRKIKKQTRKQTRKRTIKRSIKKN